MSSTRPGGTRERIQAAALELFAVRGVQQTSLRAIAERLGITKPALYYHFGSRAELLHSLVQPVVDDVEMLLAEDEARGDGDARALLARYFDVAVMHRAITTVVFRDPAALAELDLAPRVLAWRRRLTALLAGPDPPLGAQARAMVAIGGMGDCIAMFAHRPVGELRAAVLDAACAALGVQPSP
ncbi:TetR/AcrR family transcriptional regulator [Pseudonocardia adelaidensis]|uniref:Helix-turn-helix domain-containing protein n=1 Tax=Pseudonocardia adelaidensis TaxID=648754 RepID=A0ABP9P5X7_9PSEU